MIGILGAAQREAHMMFTEDAKPKERLAAMKPLSQARRLDKMDPHVILTWRQRKKTLE
jgi:hypothetical protein